MRANMYGDASTGPSSELLSTCVRVRVRVRVRVGVGVEVRVEGRVGVRGGGGVRVEGRVGVRVGVGVEGRVGVRVGVGLEWPAHLLADARVRLAQLAVLGGEALCCVVQLQDVLL